MLTGKLAHLSEQITIKGYQTLPAKMPEMMVRALALIFDDLAPAPIDQDYASQPRGRQTTIGKSKKNGGRNGRRLLPANDNANCPIEAVLQFLRNFTPLTQALKALLGPDAVAVRMLFLEAHQDFENAAWHQDVTITVRNPNPLPPGFGPVHIEAGVAHVAAPQEFLAQLLMARIYLDDATEGNGAMMISPGSHRRGRIPKNVLAMTPVIDPAQAWPARRGEIHLYRPLLLHHVPKPQGHHPCRLIEIMMAPRPELPGSLEWLGALPLYGKGTSH